jgi:hypothetical protein
LPEIRQRDSTRGINLLKDKEPTTLEEYLLTVSKRLDKMEKEVRNLKKSLKKRER